MKRLKLLVAAALLGLPLVACEEGTAPPPVGEIDGTVAIEGQGVDGVTVNLSSGAATTTSGGGHFSFTDVEGGTYTITISGYPADASFDQTSAEVTIASSGQKVTRNFTGAYIRTSSLMGQVTVEGKGLAGVTVSISGRSEAQMATDENGQYEFTGLRAGNYTVEISGFDPTDVAFASTSNAVAVAVGQTGVWNVEATYVRESTIAGQVSVEGNGLAGVTVSLQGMNEDDSENTDAGGQFTFSDLRAGEYQLAISGFDASEYGFSTTSATVRVEHGKTANVPFEGILLRTASIMGQVTIEGEGLGDVTVSLSGEGENQTTTTDDSGQYSFAELPAGNFQVGISGYDTDDYAFETTSKSVALALGETRTVPFEGILLRTSGISGRVSVEGMGLDSVTITLTDADDNEMAAMTDLDGQYAFAGLAEGDYTVAMSGHDDVAYIFETTSKEVALGDDDTQIVNFMGTHARTASVSGMLYVDEATKNDKYDADDEDALKAAGVVLALVGPNINNQLPGGTNEDGMFAFTGLRAGTYQLVVVSDLKAGDDHRYGGPAEGYEITLGVGDAATQNIPFDITHQTVNFSVTLKHGDDKGAALEGATVTLYSDMKGEQRVKTEKTDEDGMAALRFARSLAAPGGMVYAAVAAPEGPYDAAGGMQSVTWDAKSAMHDASNDGDIVNLEASFKFGARTIETDFGGGAMLGGWSVAVTSGDKAVAGAPAKLDAKGMASFKETLTAADLPKSYDIAMAGWKAQASDSAGDGGERYESTDLEHEHDGLSLPAEANAGTMEVTYTTQTLKVYVHKERDQVKGYTGNVLGGDVRMSGIIDVDLRYIDSSGRARSFGAADSVKTGSGGPGVTVYRNVPADRDVIVMADEKATLGNDADGNPIANTNHLLDENGHSDEFSAYEDPDANGLMDGAFGAQGGFHHTVELCPLQSRDSDQRHGECSTFAFVETYAVKGTATKKRVSKAGDDFGKDIDGNVVVSTTGHKGLTVSMDPVEGENLANRDESFEAKSASQTKFDFGYMPAGEYTLTVPAGWTAQSGVAARLSPLDSALTIDLTPKTGYVYGHVQDTEKRRMAGVKVMVNGKEFTTDSNGRYIAEGFAAVNGCGTSKSKNRICVKTAHEGSEPTANHTAFAANTPKQINVTIEDAQKVTWINGAVKLDGVGVGGVEVKVDGSAPLNKNAKKGRTTVNNVHLTGSDGTYSVKIKAKTGGANAEVTVSKDGMFFSPEKHTVSAVAGASISGIDFTAFENGTIHGRVVDGKNNAISGVVVTATQVSPGTATDADTTGTTGTFSLSVRYGQYDVTAAKHGYSFTSATAVNVPNDGTAIDDLVGTPATDNANLGSLTLSGVTFTKADGKPDKFSPTKRSYSAEVGNSLSTTTVRATPAVAGAKVSEIYPADSDSETSGHQVALDEGDNTIEIEVTAADGTSKETYTVEVRRLAPATTITGTVTDAASGAAIAGVQIRVTGGELLNGGTRGYVTTGGDGTYKAIVESDGGSGTVTPTKTGYTFEPTSRTVSLNRGSNVTAVNFTGSTYAKISGTVTMNGAALEGVTVSGGGDTDTTDRRGMFTLDVPAGNVTITARKAGYSFDSWSVSVQAGENRTGVSIPASGTIEVQNIKATRDRANSSATFGGNEFDANISVDWDAGAADTTGVTYAVQACVVTATDDCGANEAVGSEGWTAWATAAPAGAHGRVSATAAPGNDDEGFYVRVVASPSTGDPVMSPRIMVPAIDATPSNATADRLTDFEPDSLIFTWDADRESGVDFARILVYLTPTGGTAGWYVLKSIDYGTGYTAASKNADPDHHQSIQALAVTGAALVSITDGTAILVGGTAHTMDITAAMLNGAALKIRVQTRHNETAADGTTFIWKTSNEATLPGKP